MPGAKEEGAVPMILRALAVFAIISPLSSLRRSLHHANGERVDDAVFPELRVRRGDIHAWVCRGLRQNSPA